MLLQIGEVVVSDKESPKIGAVTQPGVMETVLGGGRLQGFEQWELLILHCNVPHYHDSALLCMCAPLCASSGQIVFIFLVGVQRESDWFRSSFNPLL